MYNLILLGPPGAGKGTQGKIISEQLSIPSISTGDMIRSAIKAGTPMGLAAKKATESGALVSDDVVIGIVKERLSADDCKNGFILDGFPRTIPQAEALSEMGIKITHVLSYEVADEAIVDRMSGRRLCSACGASYHIKYAKPKTEGKCDSCGGDLMIRKDDAPQVVLSRLETYHKETEPLIEFYSKMGVLCVIDGEGAVDDITKLTFKALGLEEVTV